MDWRDFFGINVLFLGFGLLSGFVYLIFLINKRRKDDFLHRPPKPGGWWSKLKNRFRNK